MDDLDNFIYRGSERIERTKEADSFSVEFFAIAVAADAD